MIENRCLECGFLFDDPKYIEDVDGNRYFGCPRCSGRCEAVEQCDCGEYIKKDSIVCEFCKKETESLIEDAFGDLSDRQIEYALKFIDEKWR
jgi:DNA-directed RNA polymerase subunit RPC12/RpoP